MQYKNKPEKKKMTRESHISAIHSDAKTASVTDCDDITMLPHRWQTGAS